MSLAPGTIVGAYEIRAPLGAGGMGEVYRAHDRRLDREVAIKVLPASVTSDAERLRRFELEARAAAALNHPNILAIYQFETDPSGLNYLVTELLEGETLRERLKHGPLQLRKAIDYGVQIANGLAAPHEKGIVHRDLKPENIFITKDGRVKILDFGLAKIIPSHAAATTVGPTLTRVTEPGLIMGTVGYMSPEQVRGQDVDRRSDIFAFGAILYEMITGKQTFDKPTSPDIMAAILNDDPQPISQIVASTPPGLQRVVSRCLEKNPEQRFQSSSDLAFALKELSDSTLTPISGAHPVPSKRSGMRRVLLTGLLACACALATALGTFLLARTSAAPTVSNYVQLTRDGRPKSLVGLDGSRLILYVTLPDYQGLAEMSVNGGDLRKLPIMADNLMPLSLSPDASEIIVEQPAGVPATGPFFIVPMLGGAPRRLGDYEGQSATWWHDGQHIAFGKGGELYLGTTDGAPAKKILGFPNGFMGGAASTPSGSAVRFDLSSRGDSGPRIWEASLDGSGLHRVFAERHETMECCGRWTADHKYFIFQSDGQLWVEPPKGFFQRSEPRPVQLTSSPIFFNSFALSKDSKKLFVEGATSRGELVRFDVKTQQHIPFLGGISAEYEAFSKDGKWVAYVQYPDGSLWRSRVDGSDRLQLNNDGEYAMLPRWSPDGLTIVFYESPDDKPARMYQVPSSGGARQEILPNDKDSQQDPIFSPDGTKIVFGGASGVATSTIRLLDINTHEVTTIPGSEGLFSPRWSPDGRSIAALSRDSGRLVLYDMQSHAWTDLVRATVGWPSFSKDGQYIYYLESGANSNGKIARVRIKDKKIETIAEQKGFVMAGRYSSALALTPDDTPLLTRYAGTDDIYVLDFQEP